MPLLPAEPCLYPDHLFAEEVTGKWWVLHTRPRAEKAVARALFAHRVPFFLPLYENTRRAGGRLQTSHLPLFTGYVFLRGDEEARLRALETNQLAGCLAVPDPGELRDQLAAVHRAMTSGAAIGPEAQLVPGADVEIVKGPLAGLRGKILRRGRQLTFVVEVALIRQRMGVEIESGMLAAVPEEVAVGG